MKNLFVIIQLFFFVSGSAPVKSESINEPEEKQLTEKQDYVYTLGEVLIKWTAFKHTAKAQVGGAFKSAVVKGFTESTNLNTAVSGSAVLDEDTMSSNSATKVATQQSIKAYVDNSIDTEMDVVFAGDSSSGQITLDSETMTFAGGTNVTTAASGNTVTINLSANVVTTTGTQTLTNKTFTSPTISAHTFSSGTTTAGMSIGASGIVFEGQLLTHMKQL